MQKLIILLTSFMVLFSSCNELATKDEKIQNEIVSEDENLGIELNNGAKWKVDENMMVHIKNIENDIISFAGTEKKEYKLLAEKLQSNIDLLTSNCTMKGQAHDELHKWLVPYIELVDVLSENQDSTDAVSHFQNIEKSFLLFNQYFQ